MGGTGKRRSLSCIKSASVYTSWSDWRPLPEKLQQEEGRGRKRIQSGGRTEREEGEEGQSYLAVLSV